MTYFFSYLSYFFFIIVNALELMVDNGLPLDKDEAYGVLKTIIRERGSNYGKAHGNASKISKTEVAILRNLFGNLFERWTENEMRVTVVCALLSALSLALNLTDTFSGVQ